jgi:hypothetical protein
MKKGLLIIGIILVVLVIGMGLLFKMFSNFIARKASDKIAETVVKTATGGNVDINSNNGSVSVNTKDGNATFSSNGTLPKDFPSDVPTPKVGTISGSYSGTGSGTDGQGFSITYTLTSAQANSASADYQSQLKVAGYTVDSTASSSADGNSLDIFSAKKDDKTLAVTVSTNSDGTAAMSLVLSVGSTN